MGLGVTLGLCLPVLLICLAYFFHKRKSQQVLPLSPGRGSRTTLTSTQVEERSASFSDLHSRPASVHTTRSFYSLGLGLGLDDHDDRSSPSAFFAEKRSTGIMPPVPPIPALYATSPSSAQSFIGRPPQLRDEDGSVYSGIAFHPLSLDDGRQGGQDRDSFGTMDGQRWIDEYVQRRETFRGGVSMMEGRPQSHGVV